MRTSIYTGALATLITLSGGGALSAVPHTPDHLLQSAESALPDKPGAPATDTARLAENYGKLPLSFEANQGQTDTQVKYLSRGQGYTLFLTPQEAVLSLSKPYEVGRIKRSGSDMSSNKPAGTVLRLSLVGANDQPKVHGQGRLPGVSNYLIGNDSKGWITDVAHYTKVHYANVYPGIDLVYYGNQRHLEYDFVVAPGANPQQIQLSVKGADKIALNAQGDLVLHTPVGDVVQHKPVIYQEINGQKKPIEGGYTLPPLRSREGRDKGTPVAFQIASYDESKPLIIDPVLVYSTYLGGSGRDAASGIAVDRAGNAYVTGYTGSVDFPVTSQAFDTTYNGLQGDSFSCYDYCDAFVVKLNPAGTALVYSTYLGGSRSDSASDIAVDARGRAYVTGFTNSANFPTTAGAFDRTLGANGDAFVVKLNAAGSGLLYATYVGGSGTEDLPGWDTARGIAIDSAGYAYIAGETEAIDFPTTPSAFDTTHNGDFFDYNRDAFVTKLNPSGTALVYSTYLGGDHLEGGNDLALDGAGNVYVTGHTFSSDFPTTPGAYDTGFNGDTDVFVTKLNAQGTALIYSTYLGNYNDASGDSGNAIAVMAGQAYVTGSAEPGFPVTPGAYDGSCVVDYPGVCAFITKFNTAGTALGYSTLLGDGARGLGIAVDDAGRAHVTGETSGNFPTTPGAFDTTANGKGDAFVAKLNAAGARLLYATYLGGSGDEGDLSFFGEQGIALDSAGSIYVTGFTRSQDFPTKNAYDSTCGTDGACNSGGFYAAGGDAFIAKFGEPGRLQFSQAYYSVNEGGGSKTIIVKRVGGNVGSVSVHYTTANGSAVAGSDYTARSGTLTWANGNTAPKTFSVPIVNDNAVERNETVRLILSAPTGGATLGSPAQATLIIINND